MTTTLITGGTIVNAEGQITADVLVDGEIIVGIGVGRRWQADQEIDARGKLVMPGGIDAHTHLEYPIDAFTTQTSDDFATGSRAAVHGGTTTFLDFVKKAPGNTLWETFVERQATAEAKSIIDFGLHAIVPPTSQQADVHDDLRRLTAERGVTSWKFFMAYAAQMLDDGELLAGMDLARELGVLSLVHAENGHMVSRDTDLLIAAGHTQEHYHLQAHGHEQEAEAVHRAIVLATAVDAPLYVVHVSSAQAATELAQARARGARVWGETCPQYLATAYEDYEGLGDAAAGYICSPPIRERSNQDALWTHLAAGALSTVATDHAAFCMAQPDDLPPQKLRSPGYFPKTPNGVPGLEDRLKVIWELGVVGGRIDPCRFVDLMAASPAKLFGLYPQKGTVSVGADADIVVWDPEADHIVRAATSHSRTDYNLYEGMRVTGMPVHVFSRGRHLLDDGVEAADPGPGRYLARTASGTPVPSRRKSER